MAATAKKKKKDKSGNPNVVIIVFLIMFVLSTIGLGLWGYYAQAGLTEFEPKMRTLEAKVKVEQNGREFSTYLFNSIRTAAGDKIEGQELELMKNTHDKYVAGQFSSDAKHDGAKKLLEDLEARLKIDENGAFKSTFGQELAAAQARAKDLEAKLEASVIAKQRMEKISENYTVLRDKFQDDIKDQISKYEAEAFNRVKGNADAFTKLRNQLKEEKDKHTETSDALNAVKDLHADELRRINKELAILKAERDEDKRLGKGGPPGGAVAGGGGTGAFPLILDISGGTSLWDHKVGAITRVDSEIRQVTIDRGSEHGVVVGLTFNVFANNADRAFKLLKGTIEVVKVVDETTSFARITSLYDTRGEEIPLNLQSRTVRELDNFLREGDLLFNLFWGSRVAVAGNVSITGEPTNSPFEQKRQMDDFLHLLRRNGMHVDAYVDPVDGTIRGSVTGRTRYVILGTTTAGNDKDKGAAPKVDEKEMEKEPAKDKEAPNEQLGKEPLANGDRVEVINRAIAQMKKDATDRGLIMISAENFGHMVGFRKARSATEFVRSRFMPGVPNAGIANVEAGPRPGGAAPMNEEKKGPADEKN